MCVRPHRYALAMACGALAAGVLGLHECDNPVCVKIAADGEIEHVVAGSQGDNMDRMVKMRRGGGRYVACGVSDRSPCAKPYGTGGMPRQSKRRCLATNPPCGEFRASD